MYKLALRNILRHKLRSAMTLAAIGFGVSALILAGGFVEDVLWQLAETTIHSQSGHIQIFRKGFYEQGARSPEKYLIDDHPRLRREIVEDQAVDDVMGRMNFSALLSNGRSNLAVVGDGVEPEREARLGSLLTISAGRQLGAADPYGLLIGQGVSDALKLRPGDFATVLLNTPEGALNSIEFEVVGVFQSFSREYDERGIRMSLAAAQELLSVKGVTGIVLSLRRTADTDVVARRLDERLRTDGYDVKTWPELNDFYQKAVDMYRQQFGVLQGIILVMVFLSVVNTVNMSVFERIGEFGTLMATGSRGGEIFRLILLENLLLGLLGALLGAVVGVGLATLISTIGIPMPPLPSSTIGYTAQVRVLPSVIVMACTVGAGATIVAALLPARRVARTSIACALRENH
ncbi:ABC transporter permease [Accumulibacter sp.]|uniref:ABC transporter permease n=1 Tax=Accumulibacter sp. TaxID=2053492 RepID=UPI0025DEDA45|nr:ABC transporter permease [Accumulibacter sp.]MCM8612272.1 ABC transporter permease [Accumulibacter sp.]MCM8635945.1 ABC transporter permease [Accumulibacter sp.]MCM8639446.1 ABC transporter permease [Accumulibacter sp.]